ncbi:MAG: hypothetical protein R3F59_20920 [Myxococcota bacterium]
MKRGLWVVALLASCSPEFQVKSGPKVPPAEPPGKDPNDLGDPPDWQNCPTGWRGVYTNLSIDHPDVLPRPNDPVAGTDPHQLDWWERPAFEQYDPSLDFGQNWWPVDEGLEADPAYFAVYWHAWVRAWSGTTMSFALGSADDAWVYLDDVPVAEQPGIHAFERQSYSVSLDAGVYPIEVWFAHRGSVSAAFSFRVLSGDVSVCYPDFDDPPAR